MNRINLAVVDSNFSQRRETLMALNEYRKQSKLPVDVEWYSCGNGLLKDVRENGGFDIYIIDPVLPDLNGIQLAHVLGLENSSGMIIFLSKNLSYAFSAFEVRAFDYVAKTGDWSRLFGSLEEACHKILNNTVTPKIQLKIRKGYIRVPVDDVSHIDIVDRAICYHMIDGSTHMSTCIRGGFIDAIRPFLDHPWFALAGVSVLINVSRIDLIDNRYAQLSNGERVPITRKAFPEIFKLWQEQK